MNDNKWCAMCGKWGDHSSGSCPELHPSAPAPSESTGPAKVVAAVPTGWGLVICDMQGNELWRGPHDGSPWAPGLHAVVNKSIRRIVSTRNTETEQTVIVAEAPNDRHQPRDL